MDLIIVESPTKAKTLARFLGKDYQIDATMGHIQDLPKNKLGVDTEHDFKPDYVAVKKKQDVSRTIKADAKKADKIYLATDPDREGEAIAYHVKDLLTGKSKNKKFARVVFHEITESAVKHALENPREVDLALFHAQQARRVLDRLVGYKLSPLLWKKIRKGLSAGRVQSVAVRLIVEREREIEAFKPIEYWEILVELKKLEGSSSPFTVKLMKINEDKLDVKNKDQADKAVGHLEKAEYSVSSIDKREITKSPHPPFTTSTMTQAAARNHFWSAKKTMSVAQRLYEEGLITYHRTDSTYIAAEAVTAVREYIISAFGAEYVPEKPRLFKTKSKVAQEAHEAIRPSNSKVLSTSSEVTALGNDAEKLYALIWRRFVSTQMSPSIADQTTINVVAEKGKDKYYLQVGGQIVKFDGWRKVYGKKVVAEEGEVLLPDVEEGENLEKLSIDPQQKFTEPPPRFNEASLVKMLEKLGIGRPSTYAPTISTIQDRQYVEKNEGKFTPTALGIAVNDFLIEHFPDVFEYNFTAKMEDDLDEIAKGEKDWVPVIKDFWKPFEKKLEGVEETAKRVKIEVETTGEKCPKCSEGDQVIRTGKFGKFLSCSRFPDCDWKDAYVEKINMKCPDCSVGEVIVKKTRFGKKFFGCSRYPDCKFASWRKPTPVAPVVENTN